MPNTETVSVVIPCYNGAVYLREAIDSVLRQTVAPLEVLVIDDGSTDNSAEIADTYGPPVRVISQENRGLGRARNRGIEEARGDWVAFLDADDTWEPTKLRRQLETATPDVVGSHTNFFYFGYSTERNGHPTPLPGESTYGAVNLVLRCPINWSTLMVRRELAIRFPQAKRGMADQLYAIDLARQGRIAFVDECLVGYRRHANNMTNDPRMTLVWHDAIEQWLATDPPGLSAGELARIRTGSLSGVIRETTGAKWRRDWATYWAFRDYLSAYRDVPVVAAFLAARPLPRWVYAIKDRLKSVVRPDRRRAVAEARR